MKTPKGLDYMTLKVGDFVEGHAIGENIMGEITKLENEDTCNQWGVPHCIATIKISEKRSVRMRTFFLHKTNP